MGFCPISQFWLNLNPLNSKYALLLHSGRPIERKMASFAADQEGTEIYFRHSHQLRGNIDTDLSHFGLYLLN